MLRYRRLSQFVLLAAGVIMMAYGAVRGETALCTWQSDQIMSGGCGNWIKNKYTF